ncbi:Toll-like receptor 6 [Gryllus bimaculatus]|nr:Toll-like receptor 6 [Gryllus bimaculatus]
MRRCPWLPLLLLVSALGGGGRGAAGTPCECVGDTLDCSFRDRDAIALNDTCPHAVKVVLKGNRLQSVPDGLSDDVVEIDVSSNSLSALPNASALSPGLRVLVVSENDIADASDELKALADLEVLRVSKNRLTTLLFLPEPCALRRLDASINAIGSLDGPLQQCTQLERLNLASNNLAPLPDGTFSQLTRLLHLDLANNPLTRLSPRTFHGPQMLEYLDLSQTHLHRLPSDVFGDVSRLRTLHLSGNKLTTLPDGLFKDLEILEDLYLDENQLLELPEKMFAGLHTLKHLRVNDNHLSALPVLDACCDRMDYAFFHNNNVSAPSEAALRALLGDGSQRYVDLNNNPLRAASLRWLLRVHDALTAVAEDDCACGSVHRRKATVRLCVDAPCGARAAPRDWVAAVRAAEEDGAGAEGGCEDGDDGCEGAAADASDEDEQAAAARRGVGGEDAAAGAAGAPEDGGHEEEDVAHAGHGARPASRASARTARAAVCSGILAYFVLTEWNFVIL